MSEQFPDDEDDIELDFDFDSAENEDEEKDTDENQEHEEKVAAPDLSSSELEELRQERERLLQEKEALAKEKEEALQKAEEAEVNIIKGFISQTESEIKRETEIAIKLHQKLEGARIDGDKEAADRLTAEIATNMQLLEDLKSKVNNAYYHLNNRPAKDNKKAKTDSPVDQPVSEAKKMARKWADDNEWYNDPKFMEKRKKAESLIKTAIDNGYDPAKLNFWRYVDDELAKEEAKNNPNNRRSPPAVRPVINGNSPVKMTQKKKIDERVLAETNRHLILRGASPETLGEKEFNRIKKSVYLTFEKELKEGKK